MALVCVALCGHEFTEFTLSLQGVLKTIRKSSFFGF